MEKVRYGIIGMGNQGSSYLRQIFSAGKATDATVSAICDIIPERMETALKDVKIEGIRCFTDYTEMLDSGLCDAILVETPHYFHPEMVIAALERGIHVICDKPAGVYTKQVEEMNEVARRSDALFGMMFNQRTNPIYKKMKSMIADGLIGRLQRVSWTITDWFRSQIYYDSGSWRATWAGEGGGVLINQCPHQLDLISWIVGAQPSAVRGFCHYGKWHDIEVEDDVTAYLEYECGATGVFITTTGEAPGVNRLEISGTLGRLVAEGSSLTFYENKMDSMEYSVTTEKHFGKPEVTVRSIECEGENTQHAGIINNFTAAVLGREELFAEGISGIRGVELMNAIELSGWRDGERVAIPINGEEYLAELNKHRATSRLKADNNSAPVSTAGTY